MKKGTRADIRLVVALCLAGGAAVYMLRNSFSGLSLPSLGDFLPSMPSTDSVRTGVGDVGGYIGAAGVGAVEGIGLAVGIPRTNMTQCEQDKAAGRWWDASFSCPAGDFLSSGTKAVFGSTGVSQATQADVRRVDNAIDYRDGSNPFMTSGGMDFRYF